MQQLNSSSKLYIHRCLYRASEVDVFCFLFIRRIYIYIIYISIYRNIRGGNENWLKHSFLRASSRTHPRQRPNTIVPDAKKRRISAGSLCSSEDERADASESTRCRCWSLSGTISGHGCLSVELGHILEGHQWRSRGDFHAKIGGTSPRDRGSLSRQW